MPDGVSTPTQQRTPRLTLNSDGQRHPALNAVTALTFVGGIVAFALGLVISAHLAATILGILIVGVGTNCLGLRQRITIMQMSTDPSHLTRVSGAADGGPWGGRPWDGGSTPPAG